MLISKNLKKIILAFAILVFLPTITLAVPGDYDADGKSDLSVALVNRSEGTTAWLTRLTNGAAPLFWTFSKPADALVTGRFYAGDQKYYPGLVYVKSLSLPLEWIFKSPSGGEVTTTFGLPGDTVSNLGDWDGDGREDMHVVRKGPTSELIWYVFLSGYAQIVQVPFGLVGDQVGVSDVDGDGQIELIALRNNFNWFIRKPFQDRSTTTSTQWGLNGDIPLLPRDLNNDGQPEFIISRRVGSSQIAYIRYSNGQSSTLPLGFATSVPQLGEFGTNSNFAWSQRDTGFTAIRDQNGTPNVFKFGISTNAIIRPDGTVVQPTANPAFPTSNSSGSNSIASCAVTHNSGWLLKPRSQDTNDDREGKPMILFSRNLPSSDCLNVLATDGTVIGKYAKFVANRYYSGRSWRDKGCGSRLGPEELASNAVNASGSKNIFIHDPATNTCWGSGPADGRTDRR